MSFKASGLLATGGVILAGLVWVFSADSVSEPGKSEGGSSVVIGSLGRHAELMSADQGGIPEATSDSVREPKPVLPAASGAPAAPAAKPPRSLDILQFQRIVQTALSSNEPQHAWPAAQAIMACQRMRENRKKLMLAVESRYQGQAETRLPELVGATHQMFAVCDSLDASAYENLEYLLRRSVDNGDLGSAARLRLLLRERYDTEEDKALNAAIRRDALNCHLISMSVLVNERREELSPRESAENNVFIKILSTEMPRSKTPVPPELVAAFESARIKAYPTSQEPIADSTLTAQLEQEIRSRCAAGASKPAGR